MGQRMSKTALDAFHELVFFRYSKKEPQAPVWAPQTVKIPSSCVLFWSKKAVATRKGEAPAVPKLVGDIQPPCETYFSKGVIRKTRK